MTVTATVQGTATSVAMDMTEGIIARFRTMHIARVSVLTGHVLGSVIQAMFSLAIVTGVALLVGFRPTAGPGGWLAAAGFLVAVTFALVWLFQPRVLPLNKDNHPGCWRGLWPLGSKLGYSGHIRLSQRPAVRALKERA